MVTRSARVRYLARLMIVTGVLGAALACSSPAPTPSAEGPYGSETMPRPSAPPEQVLHSDACPFEGCQLGRWTAREPVTVYDHPDSTVTRTPLAAGQTVLALATEVRALPRAATITALGPDERAVGMNQGDQVLVLYPRGEGALVVVHKGTVRRASLDLTVRYVLPLEQAPLDYTWWVRVELPDRSIGWLRNPLRQFDGMDARQ
ncbi:MAG: hypothetical protein FJW29_08360 [Acidobacteria bacterium]|nr:hypothetical protein [Acidobacteriota bacterium]